MKSAPVKTLVVVTLLISLFLQSWIAFVPDRMGDFTWYKAWGTTVDEYGINDAFFGTEPDPPIDYLPLIPYVLGAMDKLADVVRLPVLESLGDKTDLISKLPMILSNLAIGIVLFLFIRPNSGFRTAYAAMAAYLFNPAILFDSTYWGQADPIHSLFLVLGFVLLIKDRPELAWLFVALAVFAKPQAWPLAPVVALLTLRHYPLTRFFTSLATAVITACVILLPFVLAGNFVGILLKFVSGVGVKYISINAHNFWWVLSYGPPWVRADTILVGVITYKMACLAVFTLLYGWIVVKIWGEKKTDSIFLYLAAISFAFFMVAPGMRENYMFTMFPFLSFVFLLDKRLLLVYAGLSTTFLLNMLFHDPYLMSTYFYGMSESEFVEHYPVFYEREFMSDLHVLLTVANALINCLIFLYVLYFLRTRGSQFSAQSAELSRGRDHFQARR